MSDSKGAAARTAPARDLRSLRDVADLQPDRCRQLYRRMVSGVSVITTQGDRAPLGMTASTVTSVSLDPPLLLACLGAGSRTLSWIQRNGSFAVQLLGADQAALAAAMAVPGRDCSMDIGYHEVLGVPVIPACLAWSVCALEDARPYGDHVVVVGRIVAAHVSPGQPLAWHDRAFAELARPG